MSPLARLLAALAAEDYRFATITPASHARIARRWQGPGRGLSDLFGWSRPVDSDSIPASLRALAEAAGVLQERDGALTASVRVSSLGGRLFLHSAYPTSSADSVFFGPDSYRFAAFVARVLADGTTPRSIIDIGAGSGVGGLTAADLAPGAALTLTDINDRALHLARANAEAAGISAELVRTSGTRGLDRRFDLALLNPPYIIDEDGRAYRHGGGALGTELPLALSEAAMDRLAPGGRLVLYSGSPIVDGEDPFRAALTRAAATHGCTVAYEELDPDVFGEELEREAYATVDRIALIGAVCTRSG